MVPQNLLNRIFMHKILQSSRKRYLGSCGVSQLWKRKIGGYQEKFCWYSYSSVTIVIPKQKKTVVKS